MVNKRLLPLLLIALLLLSAQSIEEKKASLSAPSAGISGEADELLKEINQGLRHHRSELQRLFSEASRHHSEEEVIALLSKINEERRAIEAMELQWRNWAIQTGGEESYALWHQPWTTLEQLIMDYGSQDYVYLIPPEVRAIQVSLTSNLPIPRESWDPMLRLILSQNGVGIRQLNPFLRQLYLVSLDQSSLTYVTDSREELRRLPTDSRLCFVLTQTGSGIEEVHDFLNRFLDVSTSSIYSIGNQLFLLSSADGIEQLLKIYDFIESSHGQREYALIPLSRINAEEMASILTLYFNGSEVAFTDSSLRGPRIMALPNLAASLFVAGSAQEVARAREICANLEQQVDNPQAMAIEWYQCKHSEPESLAEVLSQVYGLLVGDPLAATCSSFSESVQPPGPCATPGGGLNYDPSMIAVKPAPITTRQPQMGSGAPQRLGNFITDPKTGTIIMVVHQELLPQMKALLRRLDIPKRMVQIDVLLVEKKIHSESRFGLDLLQIGCKAQQLRGNGVEWNHADDSPRRGILSFLLSQGKSRAFPAYNMIYNFLMAQQDMRINANPSVTTMNQTPATIRLVEEISLNMGAVLDPDSSKPVVGKSFARAQYGITLNITPTINFGIEDEKGESSPHFITLNTDVVFDTPRVGVGHKVDQPKILRRQINNQVRIEDGQTVILGGLRSKVAEDGSASLPFLGEIPGIGKLFSSTHMKDDSTEMFIFITPHIIRNPEEELCALLCQRLRERPGDLPEYLQSLEQARSHQQNQTPSRTLEIVFGQPKNYFRCD